MPERPYNPPGRQQRLEADLRESRRTLETLMSNLPGMVYRCRNDMNWTMEFVSDGCIELTGYAPEDLINNRTIAFGDLIYSDDHEKGWHRVQEALRLKEPYERTYRISTATGEMRWVWEKGRGVFSEDGTLAALEGFMSDITHYKKTDAELKRHRNHLEDLVAERTEELSHMNRRLRQEVTQHLRTSEALRESNETLRSILATSPIGISLVENGTFTWANYHMCRLFNFQTPSDYQDLDIGIIFSCDNEFEKVRRALEQFRPEDGEPLKMDLLLKRRDHTPFVGHLRLSSSDPKAPFKRAILTVSDISWRKRAEEEKINREKLQGVLEMAGAVCHELNQPLQGLFITLDDLVQESRADKQELDAINQEIRKIRAITSKLMNITRYRTRDYVDGKKIIDIDGASNLE